MDEVRAQVTDRADMKPAWASEKLGAHLLQLQEKSAPGESRRPPFSHCAAVYVSACGRHLVNTMKVGQTGKRWRIRRQLEKSVSVPDKEA